MVGASGAKLMAMLADGVKMPGARFIGADLTAATLHGSSFAGADLTGAVFEDCYFASDYRSGNLDKVKARGCVSPVWEVDRFGEPLPGQVVSWPPAKVESAAAKAKRTSKRRKKA